MDNRRINRSEKVRRLAEVIYEMRDEMGKELTQEQMDALEAARICMIYASNVIDVSNAVFKALKPYTDY